MRAIFALFEASGSVRQTLAEVQRRGWRRKSWLRKSGQFRSGTPFSLNTLRRLLTNVLYTGAIRHKGQTYTGEHTAILAPDTWERVQERIGQREPLTRHRARNQHMALLNGLLYCETCLTPMIYTYARKKDRRYPCYVCLNAHRKGWALCPAKSLPARDIEESVLERIRETQVGVFDAGEWERMDRTRQIELLQAAVERIGFDSPAARFASGFIRPDGKRKSRGTMEITYTVDFRPARTGRRSHTTHEAIPRIARLMALAIRFEQLLREETVGDYAELARLGRVTRARMTQIMQLRHLAPDIQEQILFLPHSQRVNERNLRPVVSCIGWDEQRRLFRRIIDGLNRAA